MARPVQVSICLASAKQGRRRLWHNYVNSLSVARIAVRDALVLGLISCNYLPGEQCLSLSSSNGTLPILTYHRVAGSCCASLHFARRNIEKHQPLPLR